MSTIYVDGENGSDSTATPTNPLTPYRSIQNNGNFTNAGQVIRLKRGTTIGLNKSTGLNINASQTWEAYYNSDGSDNSLYPNPIVYPINGSDTWVCGSASGTITFRNIDFDGRLLGGALQGLIISARRGAFLSCTNVNIMRAFGGFGVGVGGCLLDRCTTQQMHGADSGFGSVWGGESGYGRAKNILIKDCYFDSSADNNAHTPWRGITEGITMHDGNADGSNIVILNTTVISGHENAIDFAQATNADYGILIKNCTFYSGKAGNGGIAYSSQVCGFDNSTHNMSFIGNRIESEYLGVLLRGNNHIISGNLFINLNQTPGTSGNSGCLSLTGTSAWNGTQINNNTFIMGKNTNRPPITADYTGASTLSFDNNIVVTYATDQRLINNPDALTVITYGKNWWYAPNTTLTNLFMDGSTDKTPATFLADHAGQTYGTVPQWDANYIPTAGSNLIGGGVHTKYSTDRNRTPFKNPPSYGAFEYLAPRGVR